MEQVDDGCVDSVGNERDREGVHSNGEDAKEGDCGNNRCDGEESGADVSGFWRRWLQEMTGRRGLGPHHYRADSRAGSTQEAPESVPRYQPRETDASSNGARHDHYHLGGIHVLTFRSDSSPCLALDTSHRPLRALLRDHGAI